MSAGSVVGGTLIGTLGCATAALVLLYAFVRREQREPAPLLNILLFRSPAFSGGCVAVVLSYAMLYAMFFVMSIALVRGYHDAPLAAAGDVLVLLGAFAVTPRAATLLQARPASGPSGAP